MLCTTRLEQSPTVYDMRCRYAKASLTLPSYRRLTARQMKAELRVTVVDLPTSQHLRPR